MDEAKVWNRGGPLVESLDVSICHRTTDFRASKQSNRLITIFLYMVAELSALQQIINAMTGLNGLPPVIIECFVTTVYTCKVTRAMTPIIRC